MLVVVVSLWALALANRAELELHLEEESLELALKEESNQTISYGVMGGGASKCCCPPAGATYERTVDVSVQANDRREKYKNGKSSEVKPIFVQKWRLSKKLKWRASLTSSFERVSPFYLDSRGRRVNIPETTYREVWTLDSKCGHTLGESDLNKNLMLFWVCPPPFEERKDCICNPDAAKANCE
eukprot:TRINITY_DN31021_c0_g1_i1.p1 TRINITY_DN31021_c0_g1~~TRINITY_DN31021_c0_g1_i1.p1  ORF type:complete len:201 (+),score=27.04 TRINITY_DN31021_c0_g1_i1:52-603(+)